MRTTVPADQRECAIGVHFDRAHHPQPPDASVEGSRMAPAVRLGRQLVGQHVHPGYADSLRQPNFTDSLVQVVRLPGSRTLLTHPNANNVRRDEFADGSMPQPLHPSCGHGRSRALRSAGSGCRALIQTRGQGTRVGRQAPCPACSASEVCCREDPLPRRPQQSGQSGGPDRHLPVAFRPAQSAVTTPGRDVSMGSPV